MLTGKSVRTADTEYETTAHRRVVHFRPSKLFQVERTAESCNSDTRRGCINCLLT